MQAAPISPVTWVWAPACSATGVRVDDPLDEKPLTSPTATLTVPSAASSWSGSTCSPRRTANACEMTLVSANETRAIATAVGNSAAMSATDTAGTPIGGRPPGNAPTTEMVAARPKASHDRRAEDHREEHAREVRHDALQDQDHGEAHDADGGRERDELAIGEIPRRGRRGRSRTSWASTENPSSFGSWPTRIVRAIPFM